MLGLSGIMIYFFFRPSIEFYASGPMHQNKEMAEQEIRAIAPQLGFSADSLAMLTIREQHVNYVETLQDSLEGEVYPSTLNQRNIPIQSWAVILGVPSNSKGMITSPDQLFDKVGRLKFQLSNTGQIIRIASKIQNPNPTFLQGDSLLSIANYVVESVLGYDLSQYSLKTQSRGGNGFDTPQTQDDEVLEVVWGYIADTDSGYAQLILRLIPTVREVKSEFGFRTEFGYRIHSFSALHKYEKEDLASGPVFDEESDAVFSYLLFSALFILVVLIFSIGIRKIFKGKVEWRRALTIFFVLGSATFAWRTLYFMYTYFPFLNSAGVYSWIIQNLVYGALMGLYASLAYISWEALARDQKQPQVNVMDALWQRMVFLKETGLALIHGVAFGGIIIGVIATLLYMMSEYLIQADSQFGFSEASISVRVLTLNISSFSTTWLVSIAQIGFIYSVLKKWIPKEWVIGILAIFFSGISMSVLGRLIGTSGTIYQDLLLYWSIAVIGIYALKEFGLLTLFTSWWFYSMFLMIQPYWESPSVEVAYVGWVQALVLLLPLIYGFVAYRYGRSVEEIGEYIPEYEERIAQHLRVEKEIEIARESQYKLMPLQPPKIDGIDVYGFFLPSFEVGGDYFDYVVSENGQGNPVAITMTVVDVSGKSMRAAMPAVFTSGLLLSRMKEGMPDEVLSHITEPIFNRTDKRTFITCALARYELESKKMIIANAGHCRPILKRNGLAEFIHTPEPAYPLGIKDSVCYKSETISLKEGDFFMLYSDGLPEAVNEKGERFGFDAVPRLIESIDTDQLSAQEISQEIKRVIQKFSNYQLADDTTIICLKV